jgi:hypothetical protein
MKNEMKYFVIEEDAGLYNIFSVDDFDDDGYLSGYNGQDGYHRSDFDIVAWFETFCDAVNWEEEHSKY